MTFRALALSLKISLKISLWWPIYPIISFDNSKFLCLNALKGLELAGAKGEKRFSNRETRLPFKKVSSFHKFTSGAN